MKNVFATVAIGTAVLGASGLTANAAPVSRVDFYTDYSISSKANTGLVIDVPFSTSSNSPALFGKSFNKNNQKWLLGKKEQHIFLYTRITIGKDKQMVMYNTGSKIALKGENDVEPERSNVDFNNLGGGYYRIHFPHLRRYVGVSSAWVGQNLQSQAYSESSNNQKWYVEQ